MYSPEANVLILTGQMPSRGECKRLDDAIARSIEILIAPFRSQVYEVAAELADFDTVGASGQRCQSNGSVPKLKVQIHTIAIIKVDINYRVG